MSLEPTCWCVPRIWQFLPNAVQPSPVRPEECVELKLPPIPEEDLLLVSRRPVKTEWIDRYLWLPGTCVCPLDGKML